MNLCMNFGILLVLFSFDCTLCTSSHENNGSKPILRTVLDELGYSKKEVVTLTHEEMLAVMGNLAMKYNELEDNYLFYRMLLGLPGKVGYLENLLYPIQRFADPNNRFVKWLIILFLCEKNPIVTNLKTLIQNNGLSKYQFAKSLKNFYGDYSKSLYPVSLPKRDMEKIENILEKKRSNLDPKGSKLIPIIVHPDLQKDVKIPKDAHEYVDEAYCCITLRGKFSLSKEEQDVKIRQFFSSIEKESISNVIRTDKKMDQGIHEYRVYFASIDKAVEGLIEHELTIDDKKVTLYPSKCDTSDEEQKP